ncbi:MAG TPA: hypothetical protein DCR55_07110 [Lentisphaeria bacterium]|jgi:hypothetical protein|nr:hypothetical protein [Lentisphaeria bacterium]
MVRVPQGRVTDWPVGHSVQAVVGIVALAFQFTFGPSLTEPYDRPIADDYKHRYGQHWTS